MSRSPGKFVDLAALSMSGSLMPSIPVQVLLKYNPPKLTIVYHFENKENEQYYHDIMFDRNMLDNETDEDIVSHLYMSEAYYFNPKCLKRHQVKRLVNKLKTSPLTMYKDEDRSPERHSIHGNSPSPVRHQGNMGSLSQYSNLQSSNLAKQNQQSPEQNNAVPFMGANIDRIPERMPLGNRSPPRTVHGNGGNQQNLNSSSGVSLENQNANYSPGGRNQQQQQQMSNNSGGGNSFQQMQQQSAFQRRKNFFERKRFLNYQAHNPLDFQNQATKKDGSTRSNSGSPLNMMAQGNNLNQDNQQEFGGSFQNSASKRLPPLESRGGVGAIPGGINPVNPLTGNMRPNAGQNRKGPAALDQRASAASAAHDRVPIDHKLGPNSRNNQNGELHGGLGQSQQNNNSPMGSNQQSPSPDVVMSNEIIQNSYQQNNNINIHDGSQPSENAYDPQQNQQHQNSQPSLNSQQEVQQTDGQTTEQQNSDEQVSVYMKDNMIMRRIQIEGDDREFLMDPQGQIFDMNGQFIGTANANELEELQEDSTQNQQQQQQNDELNNGMEMGSNTLQHASGDLNDMQNQYQSDMQMQQNNQEEMMLLDDDEDDQPNQNNVQYDDSNNGQNYQQI